MSNIMELIDAALRAAKDKATAASIWSDSSAERREYCEAYDEARAAVVEAVEKLERDAARWKMLAEMEAGMVAPDTLRHYIAHPDKLDYAIHLKRYHDKQAMEATNGQGN